MVFKSLVLLILRQNPEAMDVNLSFLAIIEKDTFGDVLLVRHSLHFYNLASSFRQV